MRILALTTIDEIAHSQLRDGPVKANLQGLGIRKGATALIVEMKDAVPHRRWSFCEPVEPFIFKKGPSVNKIRTIEDHCDATCQIDSRITPLTARITPKAFCSESGSFRTR